MEPLEDRRLLATLPDLTVLSVSGPESAKTGETVSVSTTVANAATAGAASSFAVSIYLDGSGVSYPLGSLYTPGLAAGDTTTLDLLLNIPLGLPDGEIYSFRAVVDSSERVPESDETNNTLTGNDVVIGNLPPEVFSVVNSGPVNEGSSVTVTVTAVDPDGDPLTYCFDFDGDFNYEMQNNTGIEEHVYGDDGSYTVNVRVTDDKNGADQASATVEILNVQPTVGPIDAPIAPLEVGDDVHINLAFSDPGFDTESFTYDVDWGDGTVEVDLAPASVVNGSPGVATQGTISDSHVYAMPGVYPIAVTVTDDDLGSGQSVFQSIVVFDPNGAFVSGGGWITSPEGAYREDPTAAGRATFAFVSRYQQGAAEPDGRAEFRFQAADFAFHSDRYQWLVVAGHRAIIRGNGSINGSGDYDFLISTIDAALTPSTDVDRFRLKIWDANNANAVVYDNQVQGDMADDADPATAIGGGNIVIHSGNGDASASSGLSEAAAPASLISSPQYEVEPSFASDPDLELTFEASREPIAIGFNLGSASAESSEADSSQGIAAVGLEDADGLDQLAVDEFFESFAKNLI